MTITPPIIQIALDYATIEEAIAMAEIGIKAGVDWLEVGTPLIVSQGVATIGKLKRAYPKFSVLADYKTMDSGGKNVMLTQQQGGQIMTVCGNAPDETIQAAVAASTQTGVWVVVDLIGVKNQGPRARQCEQWGANMVYLHYGADQRRADATRDSVQWLDEILAAVKIPIGVGTFDAEDAVRAVSKGASLVAIGHPVISGANPLAALTDYVKRVKAAYRPRS
ncbi:MAG TPA: orotidine 5'-phosphate decarboxylase / HUMPS family protein [Tepidisphaeraceae bacterium]|jgi:3-hexulose-6-phosphate synthase/6-phospho-3-hexuloisomerase|nr:orotidine 5'-phosphate decarboxylase / HUMPS family protein [Tepidisphaeraceae bacterium]